MTTPTADKGASSEAVTYNLKLDDAVLLALLSAGALGSPLAVLVGAVLAARRNQALERALAVARNPSAPELDELRERVARLERAIATIREKGGDVRIELGDPHPGNERDTPPSKVN